MNRAAYEHLDRAAREGLALEVEVQSMTWPAPGGDRNGQIWAWLVARGLARSRAAASISTWLSSLQLPPGFEQLEGRPRDVARGLLAPARGRLQRLGAAVRCVPNLQSDDAVDSLIEQLVGALVERDLPSELRLLERAVFRQRVSAMEADDVEEALRQRAIARMIGAELTQLAGPRAAAAFKNRYLENLIPEEVGLFTAADMALRQTMPSHPVLGPYAEWLQREVFNPPDPPRFQLDLPPAIISELRQAVDDLLRGIGLEGVMYGHDLPWHGQTREGWL